MSFSSGTFSINSAGQPVTSGSVISSTAFNSLTADLASGLSTCMLKDGTQTLTANIPFGNFKITGLGAGSALTDSANLQQVQYGFGSFLTSVAGTNTVTGTATPTPAYTVGQRFTFIPAVTNTGAVTLNISSVGAGAVQLDGAALIGGELEAGRPVTVYVTAATPVFEIVGPSPATGTSASTFTWNGTGGSTGSLTRTWQKVGNFVALHIPTAQATTGTSSTALVADTALPAGIRPSAQTQQFSITGIQNNGASIDAAGILTISTAGVITINRDGAAAAFTDGASAGTTAGVTVTYFVG